MSIAVGPTALPPEYPGTAGPAASQIFPTLRLPKLLVIRLHNSVKPFPQSLSCHPVLCTTLNTVSYELASVYVHKPNQTS